MTEKKDRGARKEFEGMVQNAKEAYKWLSKHENETGEKMYQLGELIEKLKTLNEQHGFYHSFADLCKAKFDFSRQYGYRMIKFYHIEKDLHEKKLLSKEAYLSPSMLLTLKRAKDPCQVWKEATEKTTTPSEKSVALIIERDTTKRDDDTTPQGMIESATAETVVAVLQKIKNKKYGPNQDERSRLIALLNESWDKAVADSSALDTDSETEATA